MKLALLLFLFLIAACSSAPVTSEPGSVKVSRDKPSDKCTFISKVTGTTNALRPKSEVVLEDLKKDASDKGANYVMVEQWSPNGAAVVGQAYRCP